MAGDNAIQVANFQKGGRKMISWIIARAKEPSTWAGLAAIAISIGLSQEQWSAIAAVGVALAGLLAVLLKEKVR